MSGPFKMKGSSALGYGNQHSKGKSPVSMGVEALAGITQGMMAKKDDDKSAAPYASPAKETREEAQAKLDAKNLKTSSTKKNRVDVTAKNENKIADRVDVTTEQYETGSAKTRTHIGNGGKVYKNPDGSMTLA